MDGSTRIVRSPVCVSIFKDVCHCKCSPGTLASNNALGIYMAFKTEHFSRVLLFVILSYRWHRYILYDRQNTDLYYGMARSGIPTFLPMMLRSQLQTIGECHKTCILINCNSSLHNSKRQIHSQLKLWARHIAVHRELIVWGIRFFGLGLCDYSSMLKLSCCLAGHGWVSATHRNT